MFVRIVWGKWWLNDLDIIEIIIKQERFDQVALESFDRNATIVL